VKGYAEAIYLAGQGMDGSNRTAIQRLGADLIDTSNRLDETYARLFDANPSQGEGGGLCRVCRHTSQAAQVLGLDQKEAARRAGVTERSWHRWETGRPYNTASFLKIGSAFGVSLDWLAGLIDRPHRPR
jgi:hypothetical protein